MDPTAITLGLGVGTILASGVTSSVVTYRLNRRKDRFEFMRIKAEALYLAADEYGDILGGHSLTYYPVIKGDIDWNQMLDLQIKSGSEKREHGGAKMMTMLVDIYFPTVRPALKQVFLARDSFNEFTHRMRGTYIRDGGLDPRMWMPELNNQTAEIDKLIKELQAAIVTAARSYAGVRQQ